jgi:hypothetical protein
MTYTILPYTFKKAKELGVAVRPSKNPKYKIDIYDLKGQYMYSGGDPHYQDYPHFLKDKGKAFADERKRLYHIRHKKDSIIPHSKGYFISKLLW